MNVQVVTFSLPRVPVEDWEPKAAALAPKFAEMDGLRSKHWLADPERRVYGGAYLWNDRAALDAYLGGEVFAALGQTPGIESVESRTFEVLEAPSRITAEL